MGTTPCSHARCCPLAPLLALRTPVHCTLACVPLRSRGRSRARAQTGLVLGAAVAAVREAESAADAVAKVQDPVALYDHVRILEQMVIADVAEVPLARTEGDRDDVHRHLIDQAQCQSLAADIACRERNGASAGE